MRYLIIILLFLNFTTHVYASNIEDINKRLYHAIISGEITDVLQAIKDGADVNID